LFGCRRNRRVGGDVAAFDGSVQGDALRMRGLQHGCEYHDKDVVHDEAGDGDEDRVRSVRGTGLRRPSVRARWFISRELYTFYFSSAPMYHDWESGRRAYNYIITENVKRLLRRNYDTAVAPHVKSGLIDEQRLWAATSIIALDEHYNRFAHSSTETYISSRSFQPRSRVLQC
jgi:hypothetical protein